MKLNAAEVHETLVKCLYTEEEAKAFTAIPPEEAVLVRGLVRNFALHPGRVKEQVEKVRELLGELNLTDGVSFLTLCEDKNGEMWGQHMDMEALVVLGIATDLLKYCAPREMWPLLPGGVPYVQLKS